jgi:hypothetical protein
MSLGFSKNIVDPNLYYYSVGDESLILITYSESLVDWIQVSFDF